MKTILAIFAIAFCATAYAQEDTATVVVKQGDPDIRQTPEQMQQHMLKGMAKITSEQVPEPVKTAVSSADYRGTKTYYKKKKKDEYAVEIKDGEISSFHFFDKNGQPLNKQR